MYDYYLLLANSKYAKGLYQFEMSVLIHDNLIVAVNKTNNNFIYFACFNI